MKNRIKIARKIIADIYDDIMKDIPTIPEDETLEEEAERELQMEMENPSTESAEDMVKRVLKKKFNIQSDDLSEILDEAQEKAKSKDEEPMKRELLSQVTNTNVGPRFQVTVQYPNFDEAGMPHFDNDEVLQETLSVSQDELSGLEYQQDKGFLKILNTDERLSRPR